MAMRATCAARPGSSFDEQPDAPGEQQDEHWLHEVDPEVEGGVVADLDVGRMDGAEHEVAGDRVERKARRSQVSRSSPTGVSAIADRRRPGLRLRLGLDDSCLHGSSLAPAAQPEKTGDLPV